MKKRIDHILEGQEKQITKEETVRQPLPHSDFRFANPFIVLHHLGPSVIAPEQELRIHPHPHRGFAPVTFQLQGEGYHKDSAGHDSIVKHVTRNGCLQEKASYIVKGLLLSFCKRRHARTASTMGKCTQIA
jgi:redox-sensitive bicupin YhaK (pirin superfamily)